MHKPNLLHLTNAIATLRRCGFFEAYAGQTDEQAAVNLLQQLEAEDAQDPWLQHTPEYWRGPALLQRFAKPATEDTYKDLAACDTSRVWAADMEADVCAENLVYTRIVGEYARLSLGLLVPTNIRETWETDTGPIYLSFDNKGVTYTDEMPYVDDWIHEDVFDLLDRALSNQHFPSSIAAVWEDSQGVYLVRATADEQLRMRQELGWFFDYEEWMANGAE